MARKKEKQAGSQVGKRFLVKGFLLAARWLCKKSDAERSSMLMMRRRWLEEEEDLAYHSDAWSSALDFRERLRLDLPPRRFPPRLRPLRPAFRPLRPPRRRRLRRRLPLSREKGREEENG